MKNKGLLMVLIVTITLLTACDNEKQIANGDELLVNQSSGEIVDVVESGESVISGDVLGNEYYEISLSKIDSYESAQLSDISVHRYELAGMKNLKSQKLINDKLESLYSEVTNECEKIKEGETFPELDCFITINNEDTFSFCISKKLSINNETYVKEFYTINKNTGELINLSDFYEESDYIKSVAKKIYNEFEIRKNQSGDNTYFFDLNEKDFYEKIKINSQSFYISEDNNLVYYFQKYEIGSGAIGEQKFVLIENIEF